MSTHPLTPTTLASSTTATTAATPDVTFERQSLVLWCRLRLALYNDFHGETAKPKSWGAEVEDALLSLFDEGCSATTAATETEAAAEDDADEEEAVLGAAAWLYAVHLLCEGRGDAEGAAAWLEQTWGSIPATARESLTDEVVAARSKKSSTRGSERVSMERPHLERIASGPARVSTSAVAAENTPRAEDKSGAAMRTNGNQETTGGGVGPRGFAAAVAAAGSALGLEADVTSPRFGVYAAAAVALGALVTYAAVAESKQTQRWLWNKAKLLGKLI
jgi:hypothetical protein